MIPSLPVRHVLVTPDNKGPQVNVVAWTALVVMILSVGTRLAIKYNAFRSFAWDDGLVAVAMIFAVGQAVAVSTQVSEGGLGQRISSLNSNEIRSFEKGQYASDILYIATLYFSKMSSLAYTIQFTPDAQHRKWGKRIMVAVCLWVVVALFGVFFECPLPNPWAIVSAQCMKISLFWDVVGALDILTDTALIALPTYIIWKLQMARSSKFMISIAFACSLFPVVVLRLVFLSSALSSLDKTFDYRKTVFTMIADANASVVIACIPFLKPFMKGLDSGLLTSDLRVRGPKSSLFPYISSSKGSGQGSKNNNNYALNKVSAQATLDRGLGRLHTDRIQNKVNISHDPPQHDFESRTSAGSDKMIIKRTVGWDVNFDGAEETHLAV